MPRSMRTVRLSFMGALSLSGRHVWMAQSEEDVEISFIINLHVETEPFLIVHEQS